MWVCAKCKSENYDNSQYCVKCGTAKSEENPKKSKAPLIAAVSLTVLVVLIAVVFLLWRNHRPSKADDSPISTQETVITPSTLTPVPTTTPTPTPTPIPALTRTMGPFSSGRFFFKNHASIVIPEGFTDEYSSDEDYVMQRDVAGYQYCFYNEELQMYIIFSEASVEAYTGTGRYGENAADVLQMLTQSYLDSKFGPDAWYYCNSGDFKLTGYDSSGNTIYYIFGIVDEAVIYTVEFDYPTSKRSTCDRIVERVEATFARGADSGSASLQDRVETSGANGAPSAADLDSLGTNVTYPASSDMYLDNYRYCVVQSSPGREAVFAFINMDMDKLQTEGNYYVVYNGTEVTVLAESRGYCCVIIPSMNKAGWINSKYLISVS